MHFACVLPLVETFAYSASQGAWIRPNDANTKFYTAHTIGLKLAGLLAADALFTIGLAWTFALDGITFVLAAALVTDLPSSRRCPVFTRPGGPVGCARRSVTVADC